MAGPALPAHAHGHPAAHGRPAHVGGARRPRLRRVAALQAAARGGQALLALRRREGVREVREGGAGAAGDAVQAAGRLHGAQPQEGPLEDSLEVSVSARHFSMELIWSYFH